MIRKPVTLCFLLATSACASQVDPSLTRTESEVGKSDTVAGFTAEYCGINTLEAAGGPSWVNQVCIGKNSAGKRAVRASYTDESEELYLVKRTRKEGDKRLYFVQRARGELHELTVSIATEGDAEVLESVSGRLDRGLGFSATLARMDAAPRVTCFMKRLAGIAGGGRRTIEATLEVKDDEFAQSNDGLAGFDGSYSFTISASGGDIDVIIDEGNHVQDEVGSMGCGSASELESGAKFCEEPIEIDKNLGVEDADSEMVHAFDFWCERE